MFFDAIVKSFKSINIVDITDAHSRWFARIRYASYFILRQSDPLDVIFFIDVLP